ncbi:MAG: hypothetical protein ACKVIN_14655 [Longimicrobiales bacterium]
MAQDDALCGVSPRYEAEANTAGEVQIFRHKAEALERLRRDEAALKAGEAPTNSVAVANLTVTPQVGFFPPIRPSAS